MATAQTTFLPPASGSGAPAPSAPRAARLLLGAVHAAAYAHAAFVPISIAGMHVTLAVMLAGLLALAALRLPAYARTPLALPVLLVTGAAILSIGLAALAGSPPQGWHGATLWRSFLAPLLVASALAADLPGADPARARRRALVALVVWAAAAMLPSLLAWVQFETGLDLMFELGLRSRAYRAEAPRYPGHWAAVGFFWWYTVFAHNLTSPLALTGAVALHGGLPRRLRLALAAAAAAATCAVALTFSRGAWVALAACAVLVVLLGGRVFARRTLPATVALFLVVAAAQPGLRNRLLHALAPRENADRMEIWSVCAQVRKDHPLTGTGWGNLHARINEYYDRISPGGVRAGCHNVMYSVLVDGGPLLLAAAAAYWLLLARAFWRLRRDAADALARAAATGGLAATLGLFLNGLWHDVFYSSEPMYGFGFALAVAVVLAGGARQGARHSGPAVPAGQR